jgi:type IV pilus assembly protein PilO
MARSFNDLSPKSQFAVFALLSVMLVAAAWQLAIGPKRADFSNREARLVALQGEVARARATAARLQAAQKDVKSLEVSLLQTTSILPDEKDPLDSRRHHPERASESTLNINSFTPKTIVTKTQYSEWPIELGLEGGYHELGRFFDRVASMPRLMSVADLHIKVHTKPTVKNTITASCVATTFVFKKDIAPGPPSSMTALALPAGGVQ